MKKIDIKGISGKMKPLNTEVEMEDLSNYLDIAKKIISKYAPSVGYNLASEMLNNEDAISNIAYAIMIADCQYNGNGNKYGFRKERAQYAIKNYLNRKSKSRKHVVLSLDKVINSSVSENTFSSSIEDSHESPAEAIERIDYNNKIYERLIKSKENGEISELAFNYVKNYYLEGKTFTEIAKEYGVTRQNVCHSVGRSVKTLSRCWKDFVI